MNRAEWESYVLEAYSAQRDHPWAKYPDHTVFRHVDRKWFAIMMKIPRAKVGLTGEGLLDIVNLKCDPLLVGSLHREAGIFPAYHMNKEHWITVALDGSAAEEQVKALIDMSFAATAPKRRKPEKT